MKVVISDDMKKFITLAEMPAVRAVIKYMREDTSTARDYAQMAAKVASGCYVVKIFEACAELDKNQRIDDAFDNGTGQFDVWIKFTALCDECIVMGGVYLTDLWLLKDDNADEIRRHMYIRKFAEVK